MKVVTGAAIDRACRLVCINLLSKDLSFAKNHVGLANVGLAAMPLLAFAGRVQPYINDVSEPAQWPSPASPTAGGAADPQGLVVIDELVA